jgi:membrane protease YdiL (CAAX protease family)
MAEDLAEGHPPEPEEGARDLTEGWRPDPFDRFRFRWWDGDGWSAYVTDGRDTHWDPSPIAPETEHGPGLPGIGIAVAGYVVGVALSFLVRAVVDVSRPVELVLTSLALWAGLLGAVVLVSTRRGTGSLVRDLGLRFRWSDLGYGLAGSIAARVIAGYAVSPVPLPRRRLGDQPGRSIFDDVTHQRSTWIVLIIVVCIGAPVVEEIFFRGLLQSRLVGRHGPVAGITIASLLFGAAHLVSWTGPLTLAFAWAVAAGGLVLGATYHYSRRLGTSIVVHAFFNAQALLAVALLR